MIRDLEQLLSTIRSAEQREYMTEAVRCYASGAYRASVVIAVAAGMDDLRKKLKELAGSGGAPQAVRDANTEIERRVSSSDAFEAQLISYCRGNVDMLTSSEADKLELALKTRHLCAHPSGHHGSAEEARDIITTMIDLLLSRPSTIGISGVNSLILRLSSPTFFPSTNAVSVSQTVARELGPLHKTVRIALSKKLVETLRREANSANPSATTRDNSRNFVIGLLKQDADVRAAGLQYFGELVEDHGCLSDVLEILNEEPLLLQYMPLLTRERCISVARRNLVHQAARDVVAKWKSSGFLTDADISDVDSTAFALFGMHFNSNISALLSICSPSVVTRSIDSLIDAAGTHEWDKANSAIRAMQNLPFGAVALLTSEQKAKYILNSLRHSRGLRPNNAAAALLSNGLGDRGDWIADLINAISNQPSNIEQSPTDWTAVMHVLRRGGEESDIISTLNFLGPRKQDIEGAQLVLLEASTSGNPNIASVAASYLPVPTGL